MEQTQQRRKLHSELTARFSQRYVIPPDIKEAINPKVKWRAESSHRAVNSGENEEALSTLESNMQRVDRLWHRYTDKIYYEGVVYRRNDTNPDGKSCKVREWSMHLVQLRGPVLTFWLVEESQVMIFNESDQSSSGGGEEGQLHAASHNAINSFYQKAQEFVNSNNKDERYGPTYLNIIDSSTTILPLKKKLKEPRPGKRYRPGDIAFTINTAGANRITIDGLYAEQCINWVKAIRLAAFESSKINEFFTEALLARPYFQELASSTNEVTFEGYLNARVTGTTEWKQYYVTLAPREEAGGKNAQFRRPVLSFYNQRKSRRPLFTINRPQSIFVVYPEKPQLIPASTILKIAGAIAPGPKFPDTAEIPQSVLCMAMNQLEMAKWIFVVWRAFQMSGSGFPLAMETICEWPDCLLALQDCNDLDVTENNTMETMHLLDQTLRQKLNQQVDCPFHTPYPFAASLISGGGGLQVEDVARVASIKGYLITESARGSPLTTTTTTNPHHKSSPPSLANSESGEMEEEEAEEEDERIEVGEELSRDNHPEPSINELHSTMTYEVDESEGESEGNEEYSNEENDDDLPIATSDHQSPFTNFVDPKSGRKRSTLIDVMSHPHQGSKSTLNMTTVAGTGTNLMDLMSRQVEGRQKAIRDGRNGMWTANATTDEDAHVENVAFERLSIMEDKPLPLLQQQQEGVEMVDSHQPILSSSPEDDLPILSRVPIGDIPPPRWSPLARRVNNNTAINYEESSHGSNHSDESVPLHARGESSPQSRNVRKQKSISRLLSMESSNVSSNNNNERATTFEPQHSEAEDDVPLAPPRHTLLSEVNGGSNSNSSVHTSHTRNSRVSAPHSLYFSRENRSNVGGNGGRGASMAAGGGGYPFYHPNHNNYAPFPPMQHGGPPYHYHEGQEMGYPQGAAGGMYPYMAMHGMMPPPGMQIPPEGYGNPYHPYNPYYYGGGGGNQRMSMVGSNVNNNMMPNSYPSSAPGSSDATSNGPLRPQSMLMMASMNNGLSQNTTTHSTLIGAAGGSNRSMAYNPSAGGMARGPGYELQASVGRGDENEGNREGVVNPESDALLGDDDDDAPLGEGGNPHLHRNQHPYTHSQIGMHSAVGAMQQSRPSSEYNINGMSNMYYGGGNPYYGMAVGIGGYPFPYGAVGGGRGYYAMPPPGMDYSNMNNNNNNSGMNAMNGSNVGSNLRPLSHNFSGARPRLGAANRKDPNGAQLGSMGGGGGNHRASYFPPQ